MHDPAYIQPAFTLDAVARHIFAVRDQRVMLDADLAVLYGVETRYIPRTVKRNPGRFPHDFAFQLSTEEWESLRSQFVTSSLRSTFGISNGRGGRRYAPYVFTEKEVPAYRATQKFGGINTSAS